MYKYIHKSYTFKSNRQNSAHALRQEFKIVMTKIGNLNGKPASCIIFVSMDIPVYAL